MESDLQTIKEEIRARTDFVAVVSRYTRLKKTGKNYTGLCPFHNDKRPSFSVVPDLKIYKCFSCGESGDLFKFVQKKENLDFIEALEWLAKEAGIPFERKGFNKEQASEREQMLELNRFALRFFQDRLARSQEARDYLAQRAILPKPTQEQWDIGYAPPEWDALVGYLQQKRANLELAAKLGLIKARQYEGSGYYDGYRHRLIFPIHDINGNIIGFGGRAMSSDEQAKYINSPDSSLFNKSRLLYGLVFARKKLLNGDTPPVFVEGYVDVITAHQAGFAQCVATLGTSMTEDHARMLARYNPRVIICYDGDAAGIRATLRGAEVWEQVGPENGEVRVARLPAGDDPDSLLRRGETALFQQALDEAVPRVDFQIELALKRHDLSTLEGRESALAEAIPILASIPKLSLRARYADRLANLHPLHGRYGAERTVQQMLADVDTYLQQNRGGQSPRVQGYPLTEQANRAPLRDQPPPPTYRPPSAQQWGQSDWPHTREVIRKGEPYDPNRGGRDPNGKWSRNNRRNGPLGDPTPPPLNAPALSGAEKAERQLLRALFSAEWRVFLLDRLRPEMLVSPMAERLYGWVARTPAREDGSIDPLLLLSQADREEMEGKREEGIEHSPLDTRHPTPDARFTAEQSSIDNNGGALFDSMGVERMEAGNSEPENAGNEPSDASLRANSAKFSDFLRDLLEDSIFFVSNDRLNEVVIADCIRRLQQFHAERAKRALTERLQQDASEDERRAILEQYQQQIRAMRGSQNPDKGDLEG